jgi:hypothetical protein
MDAPTSCEENTASDGIAAFQWTGGVNRINMRRVIHVSSQGAFANKQRQRDEVQLLELNMRTWTRRDFVEAVSDKNLKLQVCTTLDIEGEAAVASDALVDKKFFYSGINARWFFNTSIGQIKKECKEIINRTGPDSAKFGDKDRQAVNSAVQTFWHGDRRIKLFTSSYLAHLWGSDRNLQNDFLTLFPLMKDRLGNGAPGEIFESDFAMHLQHCHDLAKAQHSVMGERAQAVDVQLGVDSSNKAVEWPTGDIHSLPTPPTDTVAQQPMPLKYGDLENRTAQWFVSESKSQPFLDFFALVPTHDKWEFRAVQNTIGKTHSADLEQLKRVVGGVLAAGFELGDRVVIAYVIEDAGQQMNIGR